MDSLPSAEAIAAEVLSCFAIRGDSQYGGEAVTQRQHALQAAHIAELEGAADELVVAALLHDVGHLLHDLPADAPDQGTDDRHETLAAAWLARRFPPAVVAPVALHVEAKRYLCAADAAYLGLLSGPSLVSLALQGGPMSAAEQARFERLPHFQAALQLRRWDDRAKVVGLQTPDVEHFRERICRVARC